ncbi:hypothetical protein O181_003363 [Austropuccinia psidii MF-1]|uniref:CCHC-type domain-containing protein n=1 Tax=Austropuccinia psidii MF-1 TaxID=1389203 RepID=A0A9Q3BEJ4_9BASI|nr:hypothetical protein [Austropuccinia psidii MF-1]
MQTTSTPTPQEMDFHHLDLQGGQGMSEVNTDEPFAEDTGDPTAFWAIIKGICHLCKQPGHFARSCPRGMKNTQPTCGGKNQFQVYYPILAPSNMNPTTISTMIPNALADQY